MDVRVCSSKTPLSTSFVWDKTKPLSDCSNEARRAEGTNPPNRANSAAALATLNRRWCQGGGGRHNPSSAPRWPEEILRPPPSEQRQATKADQTRRSRLRDYCDSHRLQTDVPVRGITNGGSGVLHGQEVARGIWLKAQGVNIHVLGPSVGENLGICERRSDAIER